MTEITDTPEEFNLAQWTAGARRPERSAVVFRDTASLADLDELIRKIEQAEAVGEDADESLDQESIASLQEQAKLIIEGIEDGKVTVRMRGLIQPEVKGVRKLVRKRIKNMDEVEEEVGYELLALSCIYPKLDANGWKDFHSAVGGQFQQVLNAYMNATGGVVEPTIPFSQKSSGRGNGRR